VDRSHRVHQDDVEEKMKKKIFLEGKRGTA